MWNICGFQVPEGTKKQVILGVDMGDLSHDGKITVIPEGTEVAGGDNIYMMPATLIAGSRPGKTALFDAGLHAGEFPATPAVIKAANMVDPAEVSGNIIFISMINTSGFNHRTNGLVYEDDFNLNHSYPGKENGSVGERIAAYFCREIFPNIDFVMNFHSGGNGESMYPLIFYPVGCESESGSLATGLALNIPHMVKSMATSGEVHYACRNYGCSGMIVEVGHSSLAYNEWREFDCRTIFLALNQLGIYSLPGLEPEKVCKKIICGNNDYLEGMADGLWYPNFKEPDKFKKGDILGRIEDFWGNTLYEYIAKEDGFVMYRNAGIYAKPGYDMMALAYNSGIEEVD